MRILILKILLMYTVSLTAQSTLVFSKQYDFGDPTHNHLSSYLFNYGNDYVLAGFTEDASHVFGGFGIIKTDSVGNLKWQKQNFSPKGYQFSSNSACQVFIRMANNNLLFTGQYPIAIDYSRAVLARINQNTGDTLWVKEYTQPGDTCELECSTELSDSSIISIGYKYYTTTTSYPSVWPFIMKTDKNGNYKWHKYIGSSSISYYPMYQKILKLNDNDFRIIAINFYNANNIQSRIIKLDTNANVAYDVGTTGVNFSFLQDLIKMQDGSFLAVGGYWSYHNSSTGATKMRKLLYKFNGVTGSKIIDKKYNWEANANGILSVQQQFDGSIITSGGTGYTSPVNTYNSVGDLLKLNSNLDSIRTMYLDNGVLADQKGSCSFIIKPDGGFALAMQLYPMSGKEKFWLIKTDSLGCDSTKCAATTGINEINYEINFSVYPVPSQDHVFIKWYSYSINRKIRILNALGEQIDSKAINQNEYKLDISLYSNGIYFLEIYEDEKLIGVKKILKN